MTTAISPPRRALTSIFSIRRAATAVFSPGRPSYSSRCRPGRRRTHPCLRQQRHGGSQRRGPRYDRALGAGARRHAAAAAHDMVTEPSAARAEPHGRQLAFLQGAELSTTPTSWMSFAIADVSSGHVRALTASLDRAVLSPHFTAMAARSSSPWRMTADIPAKVHLDGVTSRSSRTEWW